MKIVPVMLRSMNNGLLRRSQMLGTRLLSTGETRGNGTANGRNSDSFESRDEFEKRMFGGTVQGSSKTDAFFQRIDKLDKARSGFGSKSFGQSSGFGSKSFGQNRSPDDLEFTTFSDGMDSRLERAAEFEDIEDKLGDDFNFREDIIINDDMQWTTYEPEELDLKKPAKQPYVPRKEFQVTTKEVLSRADFRNVRFLANFITEAGIIIKRSQTGISAKAQRKVAREIKTARAFGLMPFTTMGTKSFVFGKSMEDHDEDFTFQNYF